MPQTRSCRSAPTSRLQAAAAVILLSALTVLGGCASMGQPTSGSGLATVPLDAAFVVPPPGGPAMVDIIQTRFPNATEQKILLAGTAATSGQNYLDVRFFGPVGNSGTGRTALKDKPLATTSFYSELRKEFPGIRMGRAGVYVQNRYGPFGYAVGTNAGDTCLYAWQRIASTSTTTLLLRSRGVIQLRLRLCQAGASTEQLLAVMYGFSISAFFSDINWNPYGQTMSPDAALGRIGAPTYPTAAGAPEAAWEMEPPAAQPIVRPRRLNQAPRAATVVLAPAPLPAPVGPQVPPPPGAVADPLAGAAIQTMPALSAMAPAATVPPPPCASSPTTAGTC